METDLPQRLYPISQRFDSSISFVPVEVKLSNTERRFIATSNERRIKCPERSCGESPSDGSDSPIQSGMITKLAKGFRLQTVSFHDSARFNNEVPSFGVRTHTLGLEPNTSESSSRPSTSPSINCPEGVTPMLRRTRAVVFRSPPPCRVRVQEARVHRTLGGEGEQS